MITDASAIQQLALRSDLPRLKSEGFFLFAQLEAAEQALPTAGKYKLLGQAYAALVAHEERNAERPLPAITARAYQERELSADWVEVTFVCDFSEPFERRSRAGHVLAVTHHLKARVRLFKGAFAYFTLDDFGPIESFDTQGFVDLG